MATRATRSRRERKVSGDERERDILITFERLLEQRSLHEISIDDIARGAGISRPTFYFYFASKEAVLLSLFERMLADANERRGDTLGRLSEDPPARLREALAAFYEVFRERRAVTLAGADARVASAEVRAVWTQLMETWVAEVAAAIASERERGAAPPGLPERELAITLVQLNEAVQSAALAGREPALPEDRVVDVLASIWLSAIYGPAAPA